MWPFRILADGLRRFYNGAANMAAPSWRLCNRCKSPKIGQTSLQQLAVFVTAGRSPAEEDILEGDMVTGAYAEPQ